MKKKNNLYSQIPEILKEEIFDTLLQTENFILERIVSHGQVTPEGEWLEQDADEWVILLKGRAVLKFEDAKDAVEMKPGDYVYINAKRRHRVEWADPQQKTIWLALHFK